MSHIVLDTARSIAADFVSPDRHTRLTALFKIAKMGVSAPVRDAFIIGLADEFAKGNLPSPEQSETLFDYAAQVESIDLAFLAAISIGLAGDEDRAVELLGIVGTVEPSAGLLSMIVGMGLGLAPALPTSGAEDFVADLVEALAETFPDDALTEQAVASLAPQSETYAQMVEAAEAE